MSRACWLVLGCAAVLGGSRPAFGAVIDSSVHLPSAYDTFVPPAVNLSYADPAFGTSIKRVSDAVNTPNHATSGNLLWIGTEYPTASPFNNNNSWLILQHQGYFGLYDRSGAYVRDLPFAVNASTEPRWSRTDPNALFYVSGNRLMKLNVGTGASSTVRTFTEYSAIRGRGESDISRDGDHFVLSGDAPGGVANRYVFVYEISTNTKGTVLDTIGHSFNQLYLAPDNSVALGWIASGTARFNGIELFDRNMAFQRQLTHAIGHMHLTRDTNGDDVLIWTNSDDAQPIANCQNGIVKVKLSNAHQTCLLQLDWSLAVHITAGDGDGWVFVETYDPTDPPASIPNWKPYTNEIIRVKLDGTQTQRLLHHRSRQTANYEYQPRATVSRDGSTLVYSSTYNLQGTIGHAYGYTDAYLVAVPGPPPPQISIEDANVVEGNSGSTNMVFRVTLSHVSDVPVTVQFQTSDGTATAPGDYTATGPQTVTFPPMTLVQTFSIPVQGDTVVEPDETFQVILSNPTNAGISNAAGVGTIISDEPPPRISIDNPSIIEGNSGTTSLVFTVTLSPVTNVPVTVQFQTTNGTATAGSDYVAKGLTTLTFSPGVATQAATVTILGDTVFEPNETFFVNLTGATNAIISDAQGVGTIVNDDVAPETFSVFDASTSEGYLSGSTLTFPVRLSGPLGVSASVNYGTADGTASAGSDYSTTSGTLTFNPGEVVKFVNVPVLGDAINEPNETLTLSLSNPSGASIARMTAIGTILNDDGPTISVTDSSVIEGTGPGTTNLTFTIITSQTSSSPITVTYSTADGTATAGSDYTAISGTVTLPPDVASVAVLVPVTRDSVVEPNETVLFNLTAATGATIFDSQGVGTIVADDGLLVSIADKTTDEGNSGFTPIIFTVSLSAPAPGTVTVDYATADGTATAPSDYTAATGTVTFLAGEQTKTVTIQVVGDNVKEPYETFFVNLSNPTGGLAIGDGQGQGTITNTDGSTERSRLMFHNFATNRLFRWHMKNGNTLDTYNWVTPWATDPGWTVGAVADFDQDGQLDYLWHNVNDGRMLFWYIDGDNLKGFQFLPYLMGPPWKVATTFDADGNGTQDIVFYNESTGVVHVMLHDNATLLGQYDLNTTLSPGGSIRVVATADVNGDGDDELVLYNSANGQISAWNVTGPTVTNTIVYPNTQSTALAYNLVSAKTDFNNDGHPDLLWHNPTPSGEFSVWFMNGTTKLGTGIFQPFTNTDPVWKVVGSANIWP